MEMGHETRSESEFKEDEFICVCMLLFPKWEMLVSYLLKSWVLYETGVFMAVKIKITVFWDVTSCSL